MRGHHPLCLNRSDTCDGVCDLIDEEADLIAQAEADRDYAEPGAVPATYNPSEVAA